MGGIWGQTRSFCDRTFDPVDLTKRRSDGPSQVQRPDMGTDTMSGIPDIGTGTMSDMPVGNVQRETFNSQLLTG